MVPAREYHGRMGTGLPKGKEEGQEVPHGIRESRRECQLKEEGFLQSQMLLTGQATETKIYLLDIK